MVCGQMPIICKQGILSWSEISSVVVEKQMGSVRLARYADSGTITRLR